MTQYQLIANSISEHSVREETVDGDRHLVVESVPFITNMELAGGYVPAAEVRDSTQGWAGVPDTVNHPRDETGEVISANSPEALDKFGVGRAENPHYDGEYVRADIRVNADRAASMGGDAADIVAAIDAGEPFDVSSQYVPKPLPAGEYDGEYRENVEGIARPDSIALLPHKTGQCSIEHGCGINPQPAGELAANVRVPMTRNAEHGEDMDSAAESQFDEGDLVRWSTSQGSPGTGRVARVVTEPGTTVSAEGADVTREATDDEAAYKLDNWNGSEFESGTVVKSGSEMMGMWENAPDEAMSANAVTVDGVPTPETHVFDNPGEAVEKAQEMGFDGASDEIIHTHEVDGETVFMPAPDHDTLVEQLREMGELDADDMSDNTLVAIGRQVVNALGLSAASSVSQNSEETTEAEPSVDGSGVETPADDPRTTHQAMDRSQLIEELVANTGLTRGSLAERCNDGLLAIHEDLVGNDSDSDTENGKIMSDNDGKIGLEDLTDDAKGALVEQATERIEASRAKEQKETLAQQIVANSAEYEDTGAVTDDYPTVEALEAKQEALSGAGGIQYSSLISRKRGNLASQTVVIPVYTTLHPLIVFVQRKSRVFLDVMVAP